MKKSRYSDSQILSILKQAENGCKVQDYATAWLWEYNNGLPNMVIGGITPK